MRPRRWPAQSVAGGNVAAQNPAMSMRRMKLTFFC
jgi:hypothetical protein